MRTNIQTLGILPSNTRAANSSALNAIIGTADLVLYAPAGVYQFNYGHVHAGGLDIQGDGDATVFDFDGPSNAIGLVITGSLQTLPGISGTTWQANNYVPFASNPSLYPGDVFILYDRTDYSWSLSRPLYHKGEFCKVREMGPSNVARLTSPLYDTYTSANTDVYKLLSKRVSLRNFKVTGTTICGLIRVSLCENPIAENVNGYNEAYQVIEFDRCYRPHISGANLHNKGDGRDDYGLVLTNCQHARVWGGDFYARRHGIAIGGDSQPGAVIGRDNKIFGATISNDITTNVFSADMHGNLEGCSYNDCTIYGGAGLAGRDNGYKGCTIYNADGGWCVYGGEIQGGELYLHNNRLITYKDPSANSRGIVDIGGNSVSIGAHTQYTLSIIAKNNSVQAFASTTSTSFMMVANGGASVNININIEGLTACGDLANNGTARMGAILRTRRDAGGVYSTGFAITGISNFPSGTAMHNPADGAYSGVPLRL